MTLRFEQILADGVAECSYLPGDDSIHAFEEFNEAILADAPPVPTHCPRMKKANARGRFAAAAGGARLLGVRDGALKNAAGGGFMATVNMRSANEKQGVRPKEEREHAETAGLTYLHHPVDGEYLSENVVDSFGEKVQSGRPRRR